MESPGTVMTLYVATKNFVGRRQYEESQQILELVRESGLEMAVTRLSDKAGYRKTIHRDALDCVILLSGERVRLPLLVGAYGDQGTNGPGVYGHLGIENITKELDRLGYLKKEEND